MEGRDLAKSFGVPFFESSAKSRINVEEAFYELVRVFFVDFFGSVLHLPPCILGNHCSRHLFQVREIRRQTVTKTSTPASAPAKKEKKKGGCSLL